MTRVLCIGGPLDGRTVTGEWVRGGFAVDTEANPEWRAYGLYALRRITGGPDDIYFFTAEGITEYGAIVRVFTAYAKQEGKRK